MRKKIDGRWIIIFLACLYGAIATYNIYARGWQRGWSAVRVPAMEPKLWDMRMVLNGMDKYRAGVPFPELQSRPQQGWSPLTYPSTWILFSYLPLGEKDTVACVVVLVAACAAGTLWLIGPLTWGAGFLYSLVLLSPSVMLVVERGNADILIFLMVLIGCALVTKAPDWTAAIGVSLFLAAAVLKLYPVAAFLAASRRRRGWVLLGAGGVLFALFVILDREDLARVSQVAPRTTFLSFGSRMGFDRVNRSVAFISSSALTLTALAAAYWASRRRPSLPLDAGVTGAAFLAGASMFLVCFAIGNNFAYRFILMLLAMPQILRWAPSRISPRIALGLLVCGVWTTATPHLSRLSALLNWILFVVIASLLFRTLPALNIKPLQRTAIYSK